MLTLCTSPQLWVFSLLKVCVYNPGPVSERSIDRSVARDRHSLVSPLWVLSKLGSGRNIVKIADHNQWVFIQINSKTSVTSTTEFKYLQTTCKNVAPSSLPLWSLPSRLGSNRNSVNSSRSINKELLQNISKVRAVSIKKLM